MKYEKNLEIDEKLIDEIVNEVVASIRAEREKERVSIEEGVQKRNLDEIVKLNERVAALENKVEEYMNSLKLVASEVERLAKEKAGALGEEKEQQITNLQLERKDLKDEMMKLSNEVKKISEKLRY